MFDPRPQEFARSASLVPQAGARDVGVLAPQLGIDALLEKTIAALSRLSFDDAAAQQRLADGKQLGKIVLKV
jgi:hypothetical protein